MPKLPDKSFFRCDEVAGLIGVFRSLDYQWIRTGNLPAVRYGGSIRIRREDLERICSQGVNTKKGEVQQTRL